MRRLLVPTVAAMIAAVMTAGLATGGRNGNAERLDPPYAIGLWGDLPYSDLQAAHGVPNLIADMNTQNLAFTAHDGDIKSASGKCTNAVYAQALAYFNSLQAAAVFTPGDNDWTDCDQNPPYSSLERLGYEQQLFFSTPYTLGQHPLLQELQATPLCLGASGDTPCVENRRLAVGGVTYATLNIVGSCNNL